MVKRDRNIVGKIMLWMSVACFGLMSVSFLLMPFESTGLLPGLLFWLGLGLGITFQVILEIRRRAFFKAYAIKKEKMQKPRNGLLTFGSNSLAVIADTVLVISFVAMILTFVLTKGYGYICYILIATTIFTFCMHCVFNGRIYFHTRNQFKVRQALEQRKMKF